MLEYRGEPSLSVITVLGVRENACQIALELARCCSDHALYNI